MKCGTYLIGGLIIFLAANLACTKEYSCEDDCMPNMPPVAIAGNDTTLNSPLDSTLLNGTASTDPDGSITAWQWSTISGPPNVLFRTSNAGQTIIAALTQGTYTFVLKVTDNRGAVDTDTVQVTVISATPLSHSPIADAGIDQVIQLQACTVMLNGEKSYDPDNNITVFKWSQISGPSSSTITDANAAVTTISNLVLGTYLFKLRVTDAGGLYDEDTVQIQMAPFQSTASDVYFFFRDPTGSIDADNLRAIEGFVPKIVLAKVTIACFPDAEIEGVWGVNTTPKCPIVSNYVDMTAYGSFALPPGTYSWTAQSVTTSLSQYPVPEGFRTYWSGPHHASGTITIPPGADCIIQEIVF